MTRNNNIINDNQNTNLPFLICLVLLCLHSSSNKHNNFVVQAAGVGLGQKFDIRGPVFEYSSLDFTMDFKVSDFMDDTMVGYTLYDGLNCKDGGDNDITTNSGYLSSQLLFSDTTIPIIRGDGSGERTVKVTANLNPNKLVDSSIYHEDDINNDGSDNTNNHRSATIDFCIRFGVYNMDKDSSNAMEVNFLENPVTLTINFSGDIAINMEITKSNFAEAEA